MVSIPESVKLCLRCGKPIPLERGRGIIKAVKYCSDLCSSPRHPLGFAKAGTVGAIAEYIVLTDLLQRGYDVFRAASPVCSCDLVVLLHNSIKRVEVRTGHLDSGSALTTSLTMHDYGRFDILAIVYDGGTKIFYAPNWIENEIPVLLAKRVQLKLMDFGLISEIV